MTKPAKTGLVIAAVTLAAAVFATAGLANGSGRRTTTIVYHLKYSPLTVIHLSPPAQYMGTPPPHKVAAVTGGTGKYLGARGQVVIVESGSDANVKGNTATFTLLR